MLACPGGGQARNLVFDNTWQAFITSETLPSSDQVLVKVEQLFVDMLLSCKSQIEKYIRI